jgi:hypothetical protein
MGLLVELLRESVLIQAAITLIVVATMSYMAAAGMEVPEWMIQGLMLILGFYFGSKVERSIAARFGSR